MDKYVYRTDYVNKILEYKDINIIKIISGVRRSGKSTILNMVKDKINKDIESKYIIERNYSEILYSFFDAYSMLEDLENKIKDKNKKYYLFLDEIQEIKGWEKAINNIYEKYNVDIYVSGSNSKLMSSEISTYLSGRYININIFPLSFKEFIEFNKKDNLDYKTLFNDYLYKGGFPIVSLYNINLNNSYQIIKDIYNSVIMSDIINRNNISDIDLFNRVVKYVFENIGQTFSANSIATFLKNEYRKINIENIYNYLSYLEKAFILYKCNRYDLQGKNVLKTQEKFYLVDHSFKYSLFGFKPTMINGVIENIIYLELKRRGYDVYIGKLGDKEIDFVCLKNENKIYIQVCRTIPEDDNREIENLKLINDSYPKYVVTLDEYFNGYEDGIKIINIRDFLLLDTY